MWLEYETLIIIILFLSILFFFFPFQLCIDGSKVKSVYKLFLFLFKRNKKKRIESKNSEKLIENFSSEPWQLFFTLSALCASSFISSQSSTFHFLLFLKIKKDIIFLYFYFYSARFLACESFSFNDIAESMLLLRGTTSEGQWLEMISFIFFNFIIQFFSLPIANLFSTFNSRNSHYYKVTNEPKSPLRRAFILFYYNDDDFFFFLFSTHLLYSFWII